MSFALLFPQICRANQGSPVSQRAPELGNGTWFTDNRQQKNSLSPPRTSGVLFGWHLPRGNLQCLPSDCVSSNGDAQKTEPSFQHRRTPDGPLLFFQRAPDFARLPLPARLTWIALLKTKNKKQNTWLRLRARVEQERRTVSSARTFGECSTWWCISDSLAKKETSVEKALNSLERRKWTKEKLMSVSDRTLTKQNRCPLKRKYGGLKRARWESKMREIKSISTP